MEYKINPVYAKINYTADTSYLSYTEALSSKADQIEKLSLSKQFDIAEMKLKNYPNRPRKFCLFIGVGDYDHWGVADLKFARKDAKDIYNCFHYNKEDIAFILTDRNASKENIEKVMEFIKKNSRDPRNDIKIYFSGHGTKEKNIAKDELKRRAYLVPCDGLLNKYNTLISMQYLVDAVTSTKGKKSVFLDSCFSGRFIGKTTAVIDDLLKAPEPDPELSPSVEDLKEKLESSREIFWQNASRGDQQAREIKEYKNGMFTYCLKKALGYGTEMGRADRDRNRIITEDELLRYLDYAVPHETYKWMIVKGFVGRLEDIYKYYLKPAIKKIKSKRNIPEGCRAELEYYDRSIEKKADKRYIIKTALGIVIDAAYYYDDINKQYLKPLVDRVIAKAAEIGVTVQTPVSIDRYIVNDNAQKDLIIKAAPVIYGYDINQYEHQEAMDEAFEKFHRNKGRELRSVRSEITGEEPVDYRKEFNDFKRKTLIYYMELGTGKIDEVMHADLNNDGKLNEIEIAIYIKKKAQPVLLKWIIRRFSDNPHKSYENLTKKERITAKQRADRAGVSAALTQDEILMLYYELSHY
ncbi:MAG: caspase family protein [Armatimonadota bacterium]